VVTFDDLVFNPRPEHRGGVQATVFFPNGRGASIVCGPGTYGYPSLYELAVAKGEGEDWELDTDTPITDDVLGWLTEDQVTQYLLAIQKLPKVSDGEN